MNKFIVITLLAIAAAFPAKAEVTVGQPAPDFTGTDMNGKTVKLSDYKGRIVVLEWHNPGCPFVRKHYGSGNMQKLQAYAHAKQAVWLSINSSAPGKEGHMDNAQAKQSFEKAPLAADHYIIDGTGTIGRLYNAKVTPHMFVIDAQGILAYMGAIDDKPTAEATDIAGAHNYVQAALDNLTAGKAVDPSSTRAYGCGVKYGD